MAPQMKGLTQFIADLRNAKDTEEEQRRINLEINNIHSKFLGKVNLYDRKKYLCKLMYIYLLGYTDQVDVGVRELFQLLLLSNYSEKQLGYLAVQVLQPYRQGRTKDYLVTQMEQMHLILLRDLKLDLEPINCLAINHIALHYRVNDGTTIGQNDDTAPLWQELVDIIYLYCTLPISTPIITSKAALALNSLLKVFPGIQNNWIPRLLTLLDNPDINVMTSSIPLVEMLITQEPRYIRLILPLISRRLYAIIVEQKCPEDFFYYNTPAPWLVIKLLQLLERLFVSQKPDGTPMLSIVDFDHTVLGELRAIVAQLIQNAGQPARGLPNRNSQLAILFQLVLLAVFLDALPDAIDGAVAALLGLIDSQDTNTKYLAIDALIKLTRRLTGLESRFDSRMPHIFQLLYDKDVLVRRKALDLICTVCHAETAPNIVGKLLDYFPYGDFSIKQELALKIAVVAETFATDTTWYVSTMLRLLLIGGGYNANGNSFISHEVWERIVQIVVNNEELQPKTTKLVVSLLKNPITRTNADPKKTPPPPTGTPESLVKVAAVVLGEFCNTVDPEQLFRVLYDHYFKVSLVTRAMLLTTFLKYLVKFPDADFIADIVDLFEVETMLLDLEIQTRAHEYLMLATQPLQEFKRHVVRPLPVFVQEESPLYKRLGLDARRPGARANAVAAAAARGAVEAPNNVVNSGLTPGWQAGYSRMLHYDAGIFFENQLVKILYRIVKDHHQITYKFSVINNAGKLANTVINGFTLLLIDPQCDNINPLYVVTTTELPDATISTKTLMEHVVKIRHIVENNQLPRMTITFTCGGSFNQLNLKVPVTLLRLLSLGGMQISLDEFNIRWSQIGSQLGPDAGERVTEATIPHRCNLSNIVRLLTRLGFAVVQGLPDDSMPIEVYGAGILNTLLSNYGLLCKLTLIGVDGKTFRIAVRCTGGGVAEIIADSLREVLMAQ